jgi:plastocyanin
MKFRLALFLLMNTLAYSSQSLTWAGTVDGTVTSQRESVPENQSAVVVWLEGPPSGLPENEVPIVSQSGLQFLPRVLTVVAGQTVSFPNEDDVSHNVFSISPARKFKLGIYPKGDTRDVTFEKPGVIDLFCSIHRHMHAVIVVTPNEFSAQSVLGKPFTIENVPAGTHTLKVWNAAHKLVETTVNVPNTDRVHVTVNLKD